MKKIFVSMASVATLLLAGGCSNLDLKSESSITDATAWGSSGFYSAFMSGIHNRMRAADDTFNLTFLMGEARSDAYGGTAFGGEASQGVEVWWLNSFNPTQTGLSNFGGLYNNINQINLMIAKASKDQILDKTTRDYYLGQSHGLRAFYYFAIYKTYLEAVIHTEPTMNIDVETIAKAASKREEIMKLIKDDLKASEEAFAEDYSFKANKGYWSKAATLVLKAEVYLWTSRHENGGQADAQTALDAVNLVQTKIPALGLETKYDQVFSYTNKGNKEIVFAVRYALNEASLPIGNFLPQWSYLQNYYVADGTKITEQAKYNLFGLMRIAFSDASYDQYDNADTRKTTNLLEVFSKDDKTNVLSRAGFVLWKYQGVQETGQTGRSLLNDMPIYRYADVLLLKAEAKMILGQDFTEEINAVRKRAYGTAWNEATYGYPNQAGDASPADAILTERYKEFLAEGKRWSDLRRFGNAYVYKNVPAVDASNVNKLYLPIDASTLTNNNKLVQNPAYL